MSAVNLFITGLIMCRKALWDCSEDASEFFIGYHEAAQETGSKCVRKNNPIMQITTTPALSQNGQSGSTWVLIYHNLFYLPVLRQICRFRPTSLHTARKLHPEQKQTKNHRLGTDSLSLLTNKFPWNNLQVKVFYLKFWMFFSKFKSLKIDRKVSQQKKRNRRWRTLRFALVRFQQRRLSL